MKKLLALLLLFGIVGCETWSLMDPLEPSKDYRATASAPALEKAIDEGLCLAGCKPDLIFSCDTMPSVEEAKSCAISKCNEHYQYLKDSPFWKNKDKGVVCIAHDTSSYSIIQAWDLSFGSSSKFNNRFPLCRGRYKDTPYCIKIIEDFKKLYMDAYNLNNSLYAGPKKQAQLDVSEANRKAYQEARKKELIAKQASQKRLEEAKKRKAEADRKKLQAQQEEFMAYIETLKSICKTYGFTADDAIATCVQKEINHERDRVQALLIAKQNQPIIQQVQPIYRNSQRNYDALSSMGRCLSTEGNFGACANAWSGYTPKPAKKIYRCNYDVFGNQISSTCREQ